MFKIYDSIKRGDSLDIRYKQGGDILDIGRKQGKDGPDIQYEKGRMDQKFDRPWS